jgi:hypothetical protein
MIQKLNANLANGDVAVLDACDAKGNPVRLWANGMHTCKRNGILTGYLMASFSRVDLFFQVSGCA